MTQLSSMAKKAILRTTAIRMWPATIVTSGSRTGFTRVKFSNGFEMDVLNYRIASIPNLKISVGYDPMMPGELQVLGIRESLRYLGENSAYTYFLVDHHKNHEYPNHDVVWVQGAQFIPNNVLPKGDSLEIQVYGSVMRTTNDWVAVRSATLDLTTNVPATGARYVLIEMDADGTPIATDGTAKTLPSLTIGDIPEPTLGRLPIAAVLLRANQTTIERDVRGGHRNDIVDLRWSGYARGGHSEDGIPAGGTIGQMLAKATGTDYDVEWIDAPAGGGLTWNEVTGTTQAMAANNGYIANNASQVVFTLPATAAIKSLVRVTGKGAGGWKIAQNASGVIHFGNMSTSVGTGGYLESVEDRDSVELLCVVANNEWNVISSVGNVTVV